MSRSLGLAATFILLLGGCTALGLYPHEYRITRPELLAALQDKLPWRSQIAGLIELEIDHAGIELDAAASRVICAFDVRLRVPLAVPLQGRMVISAAPTYRAATRGIVLEQVRFESFQSISLPRESIQLVESVAQRILFNHTDGFALVTIPKNRLQFAMVMMELTAIKVTPDSLVLEFSPLAQNSAPSHLERDESAPRRHP